MFSEVHTEFRRYNKHCYSLKRIIEDTHNSLQEIHTSLETVCKLICICKLF